MEHRKHYLGNKGVIVMDEKRQQLLEIYKLHAELADRVSQRREGANRLFVSLLTGTLIFFAAFLRYGTGTMPVDVILIAVGVFGVLLSASWYIIIRSYRQLNSGKFAALHELEEQLAYPFLRGMRSCGNGRKPKKSRYWKLTVSETYFPLSLLFFFSLLLLSFLAFAGRK